MQYLKEQQHNREDIERKTVGQSNSPLWINIRLNLLTASNFGLVCCSKSATSYKNKVKQILHGSSHLRNVAAIEFRISNEQTAIQQFVEKYEEVRDCGIFIGEDICYLGATPDGIYGEDAIVGVKAAMHPTKRI